MLIIIYWFKFSQNDYINNLNSLDDINNEKEKYLNFER